MSFTLESPCIGEAVTATGVGHSVGGDHCRYELSGVSTSGATYQIVSVDNEGSHYTRRTSITTAAATFRLVREGGSGDDDFIAHGIVHETVNANGEPTANQRRISSWVDRAASSGAWGSSCVVRCALTDAASHMRIRCLARRRSHTPRLREPHAN